MPFSLEATNLDWIAFTSLARIKARLNSSFEDTEQDGQIAILIDEVSRTITRALGFHTLRTTRIETYRRCGSMTFLCLDARPAVSITSIKAAETIADLALDAALVPATEYVVQKSMGIVRFLDVFATETGFVRVEYVGGFADIAPDGGMGTSMLASAPDLVEACEVQIIHALNTQRSPGGSVTSIAGASTSYQDAYALLPHVRRTIALYRRDIG